MCKYCDLLEIKSNRYAGCESEFYGETLMNVTSHSSIRIVEHHDSYFLRVMGERFENEVEIKFCPICGKKLIKKDERIICIRGNLHRGKDVINALIKLGGVDKYKLNGYDNDLFFYVDNDNIIRSGQLYRTITFPHLMISIEQFDKIEKKYKQKIK